MSSSGDLKRVVALYNTELSAIPYTDFRQGGEGFYRAVFLIMLRGANISAFAEVPTKRGRSDVVIETPNTVLILEFKVADNALAIEGKRNEGLLQIKEKDYLQPYANERRRMIGACIVIDEQMHTAYM